ncbi:MAG: T9SS type A sorting domain-containing protein [Candidatus Aegiribacteria sp.]|nr:T9SS type A sorting domain-containing protein [Candidatus Aegiribacteria sp.]
MNNTIVYNESFNNMHPSISGYGGGICVIDGGTITGRNNIIFFNSADIDPQWSIQWGGGQIDLTYTSISQELSGFGNITDNPMFANATDNDYHLQYGSPCIDAGDPSSPPDPDGTRADMGALYFDQTGIGGTVEPVPVFELYPVSPNPFSSIVSIVCSLPTDGNVKIIIYDITGREVLVFIDQFTASGFCSVLWDGRNSAGQRVESGVYFCRCEFDGTAQSKQLILIGV